MNFDVSGLLGPQPDHAIRLYNSLRLNGFALDLSETGADTYATIAEAWDDLYYLERACEAERLALSTGRPLKPVPPEIAARTYAQMRQSDDESAKLHLESIKRQLDREAPEYRH
jgi:hypothetical protein